MGTLYFLPSSVRNVSKVPKGASCTAPSSLSVTLTPHARNVAARFQIPLPSSICSCLELASLPERALRLYIREETTKGMRYGENMLNALKI